MVIEGSSSGQGEGSHSMLLQRGDRHLVAVEHSSNSQGGSRHGTLLQWDCVLQHQQKAHKGHVDK